MLRNKALISALTAELLFGLAAFGSDWPQWRGPNRDGSWDETQIVEKFSGPELPIRWRTKIGNGYSGPTVAGGRV
jgi:outer membrane protein assembly factor BamB